jgi:hypothetical protein
MARTKGSINYKMLTMEQLCRKLNYNPLEDLIEIRSDPDCPRELRAKIATDLLPYQYAKLSSIQLSGTNGGPIEHEIRFEVNLVRAKKES